MSSILHATDQNEIRVLAVRQPWASLIVEGLKTIEIRSWSTHFVGQVAIYASKTEYTEKQKTDLIAFFYYLYEKKVISFDVCNFASDTVCHGTRGCILGTTVIYDSVTPINNLEYEIFYNNHFVPRNFLKKDHTYFWNLTNSKKFEMPIPFEWPSTGSWAKTVLPEE